MKSTSDVIMTSLEFTSRYFVIGKSFQIKMIKKNFVTSSSLLKVTSSCQNFLIEPQKRFLKMLSSNLRKIRKMQGGFEVVITLMNIFIETINRWRLLCSNRDAIVRYLLFNVLKDSLLIKLFHDLIKVKNIVISKRFLGLVFIDNFITSLYLSDLS